MGTSSESDDSTSSRPIDAVTPSYFGHHNTEMDVIGWLVFLGILVVLLPLLPVAALAYVVLKLTGGQRGSEQEPFSGEPDESARR